MRLTLHEKRSIAGSAGGTATMDRYGRNHYRQIGHEGGLLGGRPRRLSLSELRALQNIEIKEEKLEHRKSFISNLVSDLVHEANLQQTN